MNSRGAATLSSLVAELGNNLTAVSLDNVLRVDVIILAVPFMAHPAIAAAMTDRAGKTIIDATNTYGVPPDLLAGRASSEVVAAAFEGANVVKTLNQLPGKAEGQVWQTDTVCAVVRPPSAQRMSFCLFARLALMILGEAQVRIFAAALDENLGENGSSLGHCLQTRQVDHTWKRAPLARINLY